MPKSAFFVFILLSFFRLTVVKAQIPSSCFEIEAILVDACGSPEPDNEMLRFKTGNAPVNLSNINVTWPNGVFQGLCQNSQTASNVAALNSAIISCGHILEPVGGIIPPGKTVVFVTSTLMDPAANSFANLTDTIYMIFQCPGNTGGHFKNYQSGAGPRTLFISFGASCNDQVTYIVDSLVDQNGLHTAQDGAYCDFSWAGTAIYGNTGCVAPIPSWSLSVSESHTGNCAGDTFNLSNTINGLAANGGSWSGGSGYFINNGTANPQYVSVSDTGQFVLTYAYPLPCSGSFIYDSVTISMGPLPLANINLSGNAVLCLGDTLLLSSSVSSGCIWNTGSTDPVLPVSAAGLYWLQISNGCGTDSDSILISSGLEPQAIITLNGADSLCAGDSTQLLASGMGNFTWLPSGNTDPQITVYSPAQYLLLASTSCGTDTANIQILWGPVPEAGISYSGSSVICDQNPVLLTATGVGTYQWLNGPSTPVFTVNQGGNYSVVVTNGCGSDTAQISFSADNTPVAQIQVNGDSLICPGSAVELQALAGFNYLWSTGETSPDIVISSPGTVTLICSNLCGSDTANTTIVRDSVLAGALASNDSVYTGEAFNLWEESVNAVQTYWLLPNGDLKEDSAFSVTAAEAGIYTYVLTAISNAGCRSSDTVRIWVKEDHEVYIPNAFSPNGDLANNVFRVRGKGIKNINGTVYNRWGEEVFKFSSANSYWSGDQHPEAVYVYVLNIEFNDGGLEVFSGNLTLLR